MSLNIEIKIKPSDKEKVSVEVEGLILSNEANQSINAFVKEIMAIEAANQQKEGLFKRFIRKVKSSFWGKSSDVDIKYSNSNKIILKDEKEEKEPFVDSIVDEAVETVVEKDKVKNVALEEAPAVKNIRQELLFSDLEKNELAKKFEESFAIVDNTSIYEDDYIDRIKAFDNIGDIDDIEHLSLAFPLDCVRVPRKIKTELINNGYTLVSDVADLSADKIMMITEASKVTVDKAMDVLRQVGCYDSKRYHLYKEINNIISNIKESELKNQIGIIAFAINKVKMNNYCESFADIRAILEKENLILHILKDYIEKRTREYNVITMDEIRNNIPKDLFDEAVFEEACLTLDMNELIELDGKTIKGRYKSLKLYLAEMEDERIAEMLLMRFSGSTLAEVGEAFDITRERVRQIIKKHVEEMPRVDEDKYINIFNTYNFTQDDFLMVFAVDEYCYNYLLACCSPGIKNLEEALDDDELSLEVKSKIEKVVFKDYVEINNTLVKKERWALIRHAVKAFAKDAIVTDDFVVKYKNMLESVGLVYNSDVEINRGIKDRLAETDFVLLSFGKRIRYYNIKENDYKPFIKELDLVNLKNIEISTLKLFRENSELMDSYDIRNEYELHNLLKKIDIEGIEDIELLRMPGIRFGNGDRYKQIEDLLLENAPITIKELTELYEEKYGVNQQTVVANYLGRIERYLVGDTYVIDYPKWPKELIDVMRTIFTKDFYTKEEIAKIFKEKYPNEKKLFMNARIFNILGYKVYSSYIISDKYISAKSYFLDILLKEDYIDITELPKGMRNIVMFNQTLRELKEAYELIEDDWQNYVSFNVLLRQGVTKKDLEDFCDWVYENTGDECFTIHNLRKRGLHHKVFDLGYNERFYGGIVSENRARFASIRKAGSKLIRKGKVAPKLSDLVEEVVKSYPSQAMTIDNLQDVLRDDYNISQSIWDIKEAIKDSNLFYSNVHSKVYGNFSVYKSIEE